MSSIKLAEFVLWKSIKQKREDASFDYDFSTSNNDEIDFQNKMICRVCTQPADIPITNKIDGLNISSAISSVSYVWVSNTDSFPKYVCRNCLEELKVALTFKKKCETSDSWFRQTTKPLSIVKHDFALIIQQMKERRLGIDAIKKKKGNSRIKQETDVWNLPKSGRTDKHATRKRPRCQKCDLTFESKDLLIAHRLEENCVCPPCPICGKLVSNLGRHKKIVHFRTQKFTCHICGRISYSSSALRNHLLVHSDKCNFSCPLCPYKGKLQSYLTMHMRIHTGERPYLCSECPAKFVTPSNLKKHQLTHSNKKFECNKCKKQFRLKKTLQEHYDAAHLNVRYRCKICGRDFWQRRKLLSHELRVHKREKHKLFDEVHKVVLNDNERE